MTLPADNNSDHEKKPGGSEAGTSLAPAASSPVNPFLASAESAAEASADAPRAFYARILDYSAHAAIIVGLIGFAWTVSDHVVNRTANKADAAPAPAASAAVPKPLDEMAQLQLTDQKLRDEVKSLKASVETLRTALRRDTTPEQVRMLSAALDSMKGSLNSTNSAIAQISGKVDKLQPGKLQQLTERVGRLEHQALDQASTGSIPKPSVAASEPTQAAPKPPVKPASIASGEDTPRAQDDDKPQVISGWIVRDVYQGVALVEGKRGTMEVVPGVAIPGAGVVKSIERHGGGWTVVTTKGQFASAATTTTPHPYRHGPYQGGPYQGGGYPPYRYDY